MPSIALQRHDVIVGVDTHKDKHIAVAIDGLGGLIDKPKLEGRPLTATPSCLSGRNHSARSMRSGSRAAGRTARVSLGSFAVTAT